MQRFSVAFKLVWGYLTFRLQNNVCCDLQNFPHILIERRKLRAVCSISFLMEIKYSVT